MNSASNNLSGSPVVAASRWLAVGSLLGLIILCVAWELWLAPLRPGGSWLVLKALPLCIPLVGLLKRRMYTYRWVSLLIWLYFTEGVVRAWRTGHRQLPCHAGNLFLPAAVCGLCPACAYPPADRQGSARSSTSHTRTLRKQRDMKQAALLAQLRDIVGAAHVLTDGDLSAYEQDWRKRVHGKALAVVRPGNTQEVAAVVKACAAAHVSIVPQGAIPGFL